MHAKKIIPKIDSQHWQSEYIETRGGLALLILLILMIIMYKNEVGCICIC